MSRLAVLTSCALGAVCLAAQPALAQDYMGQEPQKVDIDTLLQQPGRYHESPVIVQGELRSSMSFSAGRSSVYVLRGSNALRELRVGASAHGTQDMMYNVGRRVQITGIFFDLNSVFDPANHPVLRNFPGAFAGNDSMSFDGRYFLAALTVTILDVESDIKKDEALEAPVYDPDITVADSDVVDLRWLVQNPEPYLGKQIATIGKFRGNNLYGDLQIRDKKTPLDFVIKAGDTAIWVTGKRPRGKDFKLNPKRRRDTGEWLRVIGTPWESDGKLYFKGEKVEVVDEPDTPDIEPTDPADEDEGSLGPPPEVVFTLPLEGERDVPLDAKFHVQFSKDMKESSFNRNIDLLYADDDGTANPFPDIALSYDGDTRTLTIIPNARLEPGREIRLILYAEIEDEEGQRLPVQPPAAEIEPGAAVVVAFFTARR